MTKEVYYSLVAVLPLTHVVECGECGECWGRHGGAAAGTTLVGVGTVCALGYLCCYRRHGTLSLGRGSSGRGRPLHAVGGHGGGGGLLLLLLMLQMLLQDRVLLAGTGRGCGLWGRAGDTGTWLGCGNLLLLWWLLLRKLLLW
jgi:hypothetical protein